MTEYIALFFRSAPDSAELLAITERKGRLVSAVVTNYCEQYGFDIHKVYGLPVWTVEVTGN